MGEVTAVGGAGGEEAVGVGLGGEDGGDAFAGEATAAGGGVAVAVFEDDAEELDSALLALQAHFAGVKGEVKVVPEEVTYWFDI